MSIQILTATKSLSKLDLEWLRLHANLCYHSIPDDEREGYLEFFRDPKNMELKYALGILDVNHVDIYRDEEAGYLYVFTTFMNYQHWYEEVESMIQHRNGYITSNIVGLSITQAYSLDMFDIVREIHLQGHLNACKCVYGA